MPLPLGRRLLNDIIQKYPGFAKMCIRDRLMALFANYPFALAPGMGLNAYFAYTVVLGMGYSWEVALTAVFVEGIIFIILSLTNVREAIFNAIPKNLKAAVSVGIGLFIAFIGLQNAKIVIGGSTLLQLFSVDKYNEANGVDVYKRQHERNPLCHRTWGGA